MRVDRWLALIAVLVGIGCVQVSQRNAIFLKGYALGARVDRLHTQETDVSWLSASVIGLESPTHLARVAKERAVPFEARKTVSSLPVDFDTAAPTYRVSTLAPDASDETLQLADGR